MKTRIRVLDDKMVDDDFRVITERVTRTVVTNIYKGVKIPNDIFDLLDELESMDMLDKLYVNDKLGKLLVDEAGAVRGHGGTGVLYGVMDANAEKFNAFKSKLKKYLNYPADA